MQTDGLITFTNINDLTISISERLPEGLDKNHPKGAGKWIEPEIGLVEPGPLIGLEEGFQSFLRRSRDADVIYICPNCGKAAAKLVVEITPKDFIYQGGKIVLNEGLILEDQTSEKGE
jgi:hypothetical protein